MDKKLVLSVTLNECEVQTFRSGGPGGQNQNKRDTGVRIIHKASGARGESREQRSQLQNKRSAFIRMTETPKFKTWLKIQLGHVEMAEVNVDRDMWPVNIKTEVFENGAWVTKRDL